jgi:hypothetical protein
LRIGGVSALLGELCERCEFLVLRPDRQTVLQ